MIKTTRQAQKGGHKAKGSNPAASRKSNLLALAAGSVCALLATQSAQATSGIWNGTTDGNWNSPTNWSNSTAPGSADTATFANAGNGTTTLIINGATTVKSVLFDPTLATLGNYTIGNAGANGGTTLGLTVNGNISIGAATTATGLTETFNAPISLGGSYTFSNTQTGAGSSLVFAGNITNSATSTLIISGAGTSTGNLISGAISNGTGTQSITITTTAGVWTMSGLNSYSGTTILNGAGGTTIISGTNSSAGAITLTAGTLQLNNTTANNGGLASGLLSFGGGSLVVGSAGALTLTNTVGMSNDTTISGAQNLTFSGDFTSSQTKKLINSLTGGSTLTFAKVNLGSASGSGLNFTLAGAANTTFGGVIEDYSGGVGTLHSNLIINNTGTTTLSGANTYGGTTTIAGGVGGVTVFSGSNNSAGATTLNQGTMQLGNATNGGIASGALTFNSTTGVITLQSLVSSPTVSNSSITLGTGLTVSGANSITLSGTLSQTATSVTLTSSITGGGTLTLSGTNLNIDQVTGTAQTLTIGGLGNTTISSAIQDYSGGAGSVGGILTLANSGTTTLSGDNTYSGLTTISGSGTVITSGTNGSAGAVTLNSTSGTLQLGNATNGGIASGLLTLTKGTIQSGVANPTVSNAITLAAVTVSGTNSITFSGDLSESTNNTLTSSITGGNTLTLSGNISIDQVTGTGRTLAIAGSGNTVISGAIRDFSGGVGTSHGSLTITNTGTTTLSGTNVYQGTTMVSAGTLVFANPASLYNSTTPTAATLTTLSGATTAFGVGGSGFTSANIDSLNTALITNATAATGFKSGSAIGFDTTGGNFTYNTAIANAFAGANTLGLTKLGANTLTLGAAANTYKGVTAISAGTLALSTASTTNIGNSSAIVVGTNGTLDVTAVSGSGGFALRGASAQVLGGTGTVSGNVTVSAGAIISTGTSTALGTGAANANGTLTTGNQTWGAAGKYSVKITDATGALGAGTGWDSIAMAALTVTGTSSASLSTAFNIDPVGTLTSVANGTTWAIATTTSRALVNGGTNDGTSVATAPNLLTDGSNAFALDTSNFSVNGTSGSSLLGFLTLELVQSGSTDTLDLTYNATPEPVTAVLVLGGALPMLIGRRRRRKNA